MGVPRNVIIQVRVLTTIRKFPLIFPGSRVSVAAWLFTRGKSSDAGPFGSDFEAGLKILSSPNQANRRQIQNQPTAGRELLLLRNRWACRTGPFLSRRAPVRLFSYLALLPDGKIVRLSV